MTITFHPAVLLDPCLKICLFSRCFKCVCFDDDDHDDGDLCLQEDAKIRNKHRWENNHSFILSDIIISIQLFCSSHLLKLCVLNTVHSVEVLPFVLMMRMVDLFF